MSESITNTIRTPVSPPQHLGRGFPASSTHEHRVLLGDSLVVGQELHPSRLRDHRVDLFAASCGLHLCCHSAPLVLWESSTAGPPPPCENRTGRSQIFFKHLRARECVDLCKENRR